MKRRVADRFERQRALMPYEHLLPKPLRGTNERIDERLSPRPRSARRKSPESGFLWENE